MSISSDGQICYGVAFEEDYEFPWGEEDIEDWWIEKLRFQHSFELFDESGEYLPEFHPRPPEEKINQYFGERREFLKQNPLPVKLVLHCSYDYPMYILAVSSSFLHTVRGYPEKFDPQNLTISEEEKKNLLDFCERYNLQYTDGPSWFLSSLFG